MHFINAGDLKVHYIEKGAGQPIVFIHGNWATCSWWEPSLARLIGGYRGLAYDVRGRGQTKGSDSQYTLPELAADLSTFVTVLGLPAFHLVGHSLGSAIAMQFALNNPAQVKSLTAIAPPWVDGMPAAYNFPIGQQVLKVYKSLFAQTLKSLAPTAPNDDYWKRLVAEGYQQRLDAALKNLPALVNWKPGDRLKKIAVPKLVISGTQDALTGGANAGRAAAALDARHVTMPGIGHSPHIEAPDQFVGLLLEHIAQA